jgi:hypothetical protein
MARGDIIMLSQKELERLHIIKKAIGKEVRQREAAEILLMTERQVRRLMKRIREEGDAGIVHKSRGRESNRRIRKEVKGKAISLYREKYRGFGPTLASEKLEELDGIRVNDETLRMWLIESGDWKKVRKSREHLHWRERKHHFGEMIQIDGSHHDWFEGRGAKCVFMGYIDDATGRVFGRFYEYEGTVPAMESFKRYIKKYGIPVSAYLDRHRTYKSPEKPALTEIEERLSQFERAMGELGVRVIHAHSPQAKGRVERLFRTLQDRLIKEMRLRGIKSIDEANKFLRGYLPRYNKKFAVSAKETADLHREIPKDIKLDHILCLKAERVVRNDSTIAYNSKLYRLVDKVKAAKVVIVEKFNGTMTVLADNKDVTAEEITERPKKLHRPKRIQSRKPTAPAANHPWRFKQSIKRKALKQMIAQTKTGHF